MERNFVSMVVETGKKSKNLCTIIFYSIASKIVCHEYENVIRYDCKLIKRKMNLDTVRFRTDNCS